MTDAFKGDTMINDYEDQLITCADCRVEFLWDAGEQAYYAKRGYSPPKRCGECRFKRKRAVEAKTP